MIPVCFFCNETVMSSTNDGGSTYNNQSFCDLQCELNDAEWHKVGEAILANIYHRHALKHQWDTSAILSFSPQWEKINAKMKDEIQILNQLPLTSSDHLMDMEDQEGINFASKIQKAAQMFDSKK